MTLKLEAGKKYRTRGGVCEVEVLRILENPVSPSEAVVGVLRQTDGCQEVVAHYANGSFAQGEIHYLDLISEIKPKRVAWLNVYEEDEGGFYFNSRQEADDDDMKHRSIDDVRIACIRIEIEEGRFDE